MSQVGLGGGPLFTSNYYHFLDPPNLQILWPKFGNPGADRILAAPGFANPEDFGQFLVFLISQLGSCRFCGNNRMLVLGRVTGGN